MTALLFGALVGCLEQRRLEPLPKEGVRSVVLARVNGDQVRGLWGVDYENGSSPALNFESNDEWYAVAWGCPLARLGLKPGPLLFGGAPYGTSRLPPRLDTFAATSDGWVEVETPAVVENALRTLALAENNPCLAQIARFRWTDLGTPPGETTGAAFAVALPDGRALVGAESGGLYRVDRAGQIESLPQLAAIAPRAGYAYGDQIWIVGQRGDVVVGNFETGFDPAPSLSLNSEALALDGGPIVNGIELYLSARNTLWRFDGAQWTKLVETSTSQPWLPVFKPEVYWAGPGEAWTFFRDDVRRLYHWQSGQARQTTLPGRNRAHSFGEVPGLGLLFGDTNGNIYQRQNDDFRALPNSPSGDYARDFTALGRGIFMYSRVIFTSVLTSALTHYVDGAGFCGEDIPGSDFVVALLPLQNGGFLALRDTVLGEELRRMSLSLVEVESPALRCDQPGGDPWAE